MLTFLMPGTKSLFCVLAALSVFTPCAMAGGYVIARVTDALRKVETTIMTAEEYTTLRLAMNSERIKHGKAINTVLKQWKDEEIDYKCPVRELKPRKIIRMHSTRTYAQASERYEFMTGLKVSLAEGAGKSVQPDTENSSISQNYEAAQKRYAERNKKRETIHDALIAKAYNMYVDVMSELLAERYGQLGVSLEPMDEPPIPVKAVNPRKTRAVKRIGESLGYGMDSLERTDAIEHTIGN